MSKKMNSNFTPSFILPLKFIFSDSDLIYIWIRTNLFYYNNLVLKLLNDGINQIFIGRMEEEVFEQDLNVADVYVV